MRPRDSLGLSVLAAAALVLSLASPPAAALKSDRKQPLDVKADATDGSLGDGLSTLRGNVEIRQGTLLIRADVATVEKVEGRVRRFELTGEPVHLQQEIEEEGLVSAEARQVDYEVATGMVTLTGNADVDHPQYHISGEMLQYDMNVQHFKGSGGDDNGRIRIVLDPEMIPGEVEAGATGDGAAPESQDDPDGAQQSADEDPTGDGQPG